MHACIGRTAKTGPGTARRARWSTRTALRPRGKRPGRPTRPLSFRPCRPSSTLVLPHQDAYAYGPLGVDTFYGTCTARCGPLAPVWHRWPRWPGAAHRRPHSGRCYGACLRWLAVRPGAGVPACSVPGDWRAPIRPPGRPAHVRLLRKSPGDTNANRTFVTAPAPARSLAKCAYARPIHFASSKQWISCG